MTFKSLPFEPRVLKATEARLQRIYDAAKLGLKGEALALAAGMLPVEYNRLCQLDPLADMAAKKGRADAEIELAGYMMEAARDGDTKATLAILQHRHDWTAKQEVSVDVHQRISITAALEAANARVVDVAKQVDYTSPQRLEGRLVEDVEALPCTATPISA
jgi:hypothetical protein